jgi:signal transduction histidine kinase
VSVTLSRTRHRVILEIADNGTGFDPALVAAGLGLTSMRERAAAVGGVLRISSAPGAGTTVRMEVPT